MSGDELLTPEERATAAIVERLGETGSVLELLELLRSQDGGPELVRAALTLLGELDPTLLVEITLDALISAHVTGDGHALQTRRVVERGGES